MTLHISLDALETLIIQATRRHLYRSQDTWLSAENREAFDEIGPLLQIFIDLLRDHDPFAVKLRPLFDSKTTLFELQLLYVISEKHCGNEKTVTEVLHWWFPQDSVQIAQEILNDIATALNKAGLKMRTTRQLKARMLVASVSRNNRNVPSVSIKHGLNLKFKNLNTETLH